MFELLSFWKWMVTRSCQAPKSQVNGDKLVFLSELFLLKVWVRVNCSCSVFFLALSGHIIHTQPVSGVRLDSWSSDRPKFEFPSRLSCLPFTDKHLFPFPSSSDPPSLIQHNWLDRKNRILNIFNVSVITSQEQRH